MDRSHGTNDSFNCCQLVVLGSYLISVASALSLSSFEPDCYIVAHFTLGTLLLYTTYVVEVISTLYLCSLLL